MKTAREKERGRADLILLLRRSEERKMAVWQERKENVEGMEELVVEGGIYIVFTSSPFKEARFLARTVLKREWMNF